MPVRNPYMAESYKLAPEGKLYSTKYLNKNEALVTQRKDPNRIFSLFFLFQACLLYIIIDIQRSQESKVRIKDWILVLLLICKVASIYIHEFF